MVMILTTPLGVPVIVKGDTALPIGNTTVMDVAALELEDAGVIADAIAQCKTALAMIVSLDPMQSDEDWYADFMGALNITSFAETVQALFHARHVVSETLRENSHADA